MNDSERDFPKLSEEDLRNLTLGVYQVKMARSYSQEHLMTLVVTKYYYQQ